jgi:acyl-CoA synthetase (NDP forming)
MIAGADAKSFRECLEILLAAPEIDLAIVAFVPPVMVDPMEVVQAVTEARKKSRKPVYMVLMAEEEYYRRIPVEMPESPPIYRYPEVAAYTASEMVRYVRAPFSRMHRPANTWIPTPPFDCSKPTAFRSRDGEGRGLPKKQSRRRKVSAIRSQ